MESTKYLGVFQGILIVVIVPTMFTNFLRFYSTIPEGERNFCWKASRVRLSGCRVRSCRACILAAMSSPSPCSSSSRADNLNSTTETFNTSNKYFNECARYNWCTQTFICVYENFQDICHKNFSP